MKRHFLRQFAFVALLAVVLGALAPTISYALAANQGDSAVEMCTSSGLQKVEAQHNGNDANHSPDGQGIKHCPFCLSSHTATLFPGLPPVPALAPVDNVGFVPVFDKVAYDPYLSWFAIRNHAPPALS